MLKNVGRLALASLFVTAFTGSALAQDDMDGEATPPADDWSDSSSTPATTSAPEAPAASSSGDAFTMGISTEFPTGGDGGSANILYGLDANTFLDLQLGINFGPGAPGVDAMGNPVAGDDAFGIELGAGYRMYKDSKGKIRPYLEPAVAVLVGDFSAAGDTLSLAAGAIMGVDYALMDQFTLGTGIGGALTFADSFDTITFGLFTASINATFWW